jgi:hypothetical protein
MVNDPRIEERLARARRSPTGDNLRKHLPAYWGRAAYKRQHQQHADKGIAVHIGSPLIQRV